MSRRCLLFLVGLGPVFWLQWSLHVHLEINQWDPKGVETDSAPDSIRYTPLKKQANDAHMYMCVYIYMYIYIYTPLHVHHAI